MQTSLLLGRHYCCNLNKILIFTKGYVSKAELETARSSPPSFAHKTMYVCTGKIEWKHNVDSW